MLPPLPGWCVVGREKYALVADPRREPVQALPHGGDHGFDGLGQPRPTPAGHPVVLLRGSVPARGFSSAKDVGGRPTVEVTTSFPVAGRRSRWFDRRLSCARGLSKTGWEPLRPPLATNRVLA